MKRFLKWLPGKTADFSISLLLAMIVAGCLTRESIAAEKASALSPGEWEFRVEPDDQLFPSLCIATATIKAPTASKAPSSSASSGKLGLVVIRLSSPTANCKVRVVVTAKGLMEESVALQTLKNAGSTY